MEIIRNTKLPRLAVMALGLAALASLQSTAAADAPSGHFVSKDGTVEDSATMLTWQQDAPSEKYTWPDALGYCAALDLQGTGWRLPTVKELQTLVDEARAMPAIDQTAFPKTARAEYWTSSRVASFPGNAWTVSFAYGFDGFFDIGTTEHVRCVR
jgi:formylglycine-generating enzyme required for sulfatase activity